MTATLRRTRPTRRTALVRAGALVLTAALALTACASGDAADDASPSASSVESDDAMAGDDAKEGDDAMAGDDVVEGDDAMTDGPLSFTAATVSGGELDVSTLAGKPVVLWFWAPWCTICRSEAPDLSEVVADLGDEVTFLGVAGRGEVDAMQGFVSDTKVTGFEHLADVDGSIWSRFSVSSQPAYAFVSADGSVETVVGALGADGLRDRASALLGG